MAESTSAAPALHTDIPGGNFDEKATAGKPRPEAEEEEDEDIDALIEDLESHDGHGAGEEDDEDEENGVQGGRMPPEEMLQTDTRIGLTEQEVVSRRRK